MILDEISALLQKGKAKDVERLTSEALSSGLTPTQVLEDGLLAGMSVVGEKFKNGNVFIPEVLIAARAMNAGVAVLRPYLVEAGVESRGTVVLGTVKGDLHDIGKNIVRMMMEGKGLKVIDLGVDVPAEKFVAAAQENNADIIACSALLTTTMGEMKTVVDLVNASPLKGKVKIMVGGAPITPEYCKSIGADCYTADGASAAEEAVKLCGGNA